MLQRDAARVLYQKLLEFLGKRYHNTRNE
jgi:hypothetical protein